MYTSFFGLKEKPFNLTPDPRYLFLGLNHREALDHLLYGINERKGFITITGGIGTGKTTLCRALLSRLEASTRSALLFNSFMSEMELLRAINREYNIGAEPAWESKNDCIEALNRFLLRTFSEGGNAVLLIDEAQNLSHAALEQIRMLSNLETEKEKLIQIVLVGQPELKESLAAPSLRQLDERVMVRYELNPIDFKELQRYVEHRLVVAGGRGDLRFKRGALKRIYAYSRGNPRRINAVCDQALLIAYTKEKYVIPRSIVEEAIQGLRGNTGAGVPSNDLSWKRIASAFVYLLVLIMAAALAGWTYREEVTRLFSGGRDAVGLKIRDTRTLSLEPTSGPKNEPEPKVEEAATLVLDEEKSLTGLFTQFRALRGSEDPDMEKAHLNLVSHSVAPEYYVMLKKPFRIHLPDDPSTTPASARYLLIREVTGEGAVAIDSRQKERPITRDYILSHWNGKISWLYPALPEKRYLSQGTQGASVLKVQRMFHRIGYLVEPTGVYDESLSRVVRKFQRDFGLNPDGIAGPRTMALLYQVTD